MSGLVLDNNSDDSSRSGKKEKNKYAVNTLKNTITEKFISDFFNVSKALGIDCALVSNGHNNIERLQATGSMTFSDIQSFADWILDKTK